jgi:hypothetical protein
MVREDMENQGNYCHWILNQIELDEGRTVWRRGKAERGCVDPSALLKEKPDEVEAIGDRTH